MGHVGNLRVHGLASPREGRAKRLECGRVRRCAEAVRAQPGEGDFLLAVDVFSLFLSPVEGIG